MDSAKYDDPVFEARWLHEQRAAVEAYLSAERVAHGGVADAPAWFVAPYLAIWSVTSVARSPRIGWWVASGDVPSDYLSSAEVHDAREAVRAFSERWEDLAARMERGDSHPTMQVGTADVSRTLAPLLRARAELLVSLADDDSCWNRAGEQ